MPSRKYGWVFRAMVLGLLKTSYHEPCGHVAEPGASLLRSEFNARRPHETGHKTVPGNNQTAGGAVFDALVDCD